VNERHAVPFVGAALAAVLSSGLTAVYLHARYPDVVSVRTPPQVAPDLVHLAALLVDPGAPFRPVDGGRPVDLAAAGASRDGLVSLGFTRGWSRSWVTSDARVDAFVFEFSSGNGAAGYAGGIGRAARLLIKPEPFAVPGVPGASGLADTVRDRNGRYAQLVVLHRDTRAVLLVLSDRTPARGTTLADLARRQYDALGT
jgi:hypothetical protein